MFYNVENFFDTFDEQGKNDNEFLPEGSRHWTYGRYLNKMNNISKVITAVGEWDSPALVGLCEVENEKVMEDLTKKSPLKKQGYRYIISDCDDDRGIDVALMYQRDRFKYITHTAYKIIFPKNPRQKTRDILHVTGKVLSGDTLDVFICHFPSRRGGELKSESNRLLAATLLRLKVDKVMSIRKRANILIMGDFNDQPSNKSIFNVLGARPINKNIKKENLYNLFYHYEKIDSKGTYKFQREWNVLDQMIVSGTLLNNNDNFHIKPETSKIVDIEFLLTEDKTNGGKRPKKTYHGMKHEGGFSDHLPICVDFFVSSFEK